MGWSGADARIARIHHEGLSDRVSPKGPTVTYPTRRLLGLSDADRSVVRTLILEYLSKMG